ncbi:unnamed protein product [Linum trigynum]|uniref:Uncharacterized protein n=1 Tax=Linum trigynum TaxID=586398 RepID=A0AAV2EAP2_9ROSI
MRTQQKLIPKKTPITWISRLRWDFIRDTLIEVGLPSTWISRIMTCVEENKMRINWNGKLTDPITPSRGVRQGDPLSPYLFVLCMERLAHRIEIAVADRQWKPLSVTSHGFKLSHLFFADDLILFAEAGSKQIDIIKQCLEDFCSSSGQKVNLNKSVLYVSPNIRRDMAQNLSNRANIPLTADLGRYLGLNAIHGRVTKTRYKELVLRIQKKLATWKSNCLSLASRITMVRSVASSMAVYPMFSELLPASVCNDLDRINRQFIWGEEDGKSKFHPVAWELMTTPKSQGGIGIRPTKLANQAMLAKGGWKLTTREDSLWTKLLLEKYGGNREGINILQKKQGSSLAWRSFVSTANLLKKGLAINVKSGRNTHFWLDPWILQVPLIERAVADVSEDQKHKTVADMWDPESGWRMEEFHHLLPNQITDKIRATPIDPLAMEEDRSFWSLTTNGHFSVQSAYKAILQQQEQQPSQIWKRIWKLQVPERVRVFVWMAAHGKITTNSVRKHRHLAQDDSCPDCPGAPETVLHCLRDCHRVKVVWNRTVEQQNQAEFYNMSHEAWFKENLKDDSTGSWTGNWNSFFSLMIWYIWKCRNENIFRGIKLSIPTFCHYVTAKATDWAKTWDSASKTLSTSSPHRREEVLVGWSKPPVGWHKLNTDGAAQGHQGIVSTGGALRDHDGMWTGGFISKLGSGSAILAELWGILKGLELAWKKGSRFLILESDSQLALHLIEKRTDNVHPHSTILGAIRRLLAKEWVVRLVHTYREGNRVADWLSKHSLIYPFGTFELDDPPSELNRICCEDMLRVSFPRQVPQRDAP